MCVCLRRGCVARRKTIDGPQQRRPRLVIEPFIGDIALAICIASPRGVRCNCIEACCFFAQRYRVGWLDIRFCLCLADAHPVPSLEGGGGRFARVRGLVNAQRSGCPNDASWSIIPGTPKKHGCFCTADRGASASCGCSWKKERHGAASNDVSLEAVGRLGTEGYECVTLGQGWIRIERSLVPPISTHVRIAAAHASLPGTPSLSHPFAGGDVVGHLGVVTAWGVAWLADTLPTSQM